MAVTHSTTARDNATNAVVDLLDAAASKLVFRVGGTLGSPGTAAATLTFATPAFGASSAETNGIFSDMFFSPLRGVGNSNASNLKCLTRGDN